MAKWEALLGQDFEWGVKDCASLIREFYKLEFDMDLPDYARPSDWDADLMDILRIGFKTNGFLPTDPSMDGLKFGDVILVCLKSRTPNHCMVYLGEGEVLHHFYNNRSRKQTYTGGWQGLTSIIYRHQDLFELNTAQEKKLDIIELVNPNVADKLRDYVPYAD